MALIMMQYTVIETLASDFNSLIIIQYLMIYYDYMTYKNYSSSKIVSRIY